jgi:hypothetical protein
MQRYTFPRHSVLLSAVFGNVNQGPGEGMAPLIKSRGPGLWQALGGPGRTKSCALNGDLQRPNHALQKGSGK